MSNASKTSNKAGLHCELSPLHMALAAGLCIAGASAFAQETATLSTVTVTESSASAVKVEEAVSSKFTAPLKETPKSVQVISEEVIKQTGATNLQDALRASSGITFGSGEGGSTAGDRPFMRGSDAQSSIFIDGMRDIAPSAREVFNLEAIEVVKGADSAYAGRGGAGGSINMSTKKPKNDNFISGDVGLGTDNYKRATLDGNWKLNETTAVRLNAMAHDADIPGRNGPENKRWGIAPSVAFGLNTPDRLTLSLQHLQTDDIPDGGTPWNLPTSFPNVGVFELKPTTGGNRENWYGRTGLDMRKEKSDVLTANYEHDFSSTNKLRNTLRYTKASQDYIWAQPDDSKGSVAGDKVFRRYNTRSTDTTTWQNVTEATGEAQWGGKRNRYAFGVELSRETSKYGSITGSDFTSNASKCTAINANCTSLSNPDHRPYNGTIVFGDKTNKFETNTVALYGFDTIDLNDQWLLNAGLRLDHYRTKATSSSAAVSSVETLLNYQLGAVYKLSPEGNLYASIGSSSTPGNANLGLDGDTTIFDGSGARGTINASALDPEKTRSIELGTKWELLNKRLGVNAAIFRNEVTNARVSDATGNANNDNLGRTNGKKVINGFEIGATGSVAKGVDVTFGYTFMDSKLKDNGFLANGTPKAGTGLAFPGAPKHSASLWATYKPNNKLTLGLGAYAQSTMVASYAYANNNQTLVKRQVSGYTRFDAMVSYVINPNVTFQLNLMNLGDKEYYASANSPHYATMAAGRSAVASLKFTY
jgi:catecholate siderophore receptor